MTNIKNDIEEEKQIYEDSNGTGVISSIIFMIVLTIVMTLVSNLIN